MLAALERGLWPGVARCLGTRRTYDQFLFCSKRNGFGVGDVRRGNKAFLLGEGAWSVSPLPWPVLRQEFSIPENARRQCKDRPWIPLARFGMTPFGLSDETTRNWVRFLANPQPS